MGILSSSAWILDDNACPHTAVHTREQLEHFNWELLDNLLYSPDLAPSDYHLPEELVGITALQQ
jgi:hypothetical protein